MAYINGSEHACSGYGEDNEPPEYDYYNPKCAVCGGQPNQMTDYFESYGVETCSDCDRWLQTLERITISNEDKDYIFSAVFEHVQEATCKYLDQKDRYLGDSECSMHYSDIVKKGNSILVKLAADGVALDYNMSEYIKGLQS